MYKKIFAILSVLLILIVSVGVISAEDINGTSAVDEGDALGDEGRVDDEPVMQGLYIKAIWNNDTPSDRPDKIVVYIYADNVKIDEVTLSEENNWCVDDYATDKAGKLSIQAPGVDGYKTNVIDGGIEQIVEYDYVGVTPAENETDNSAADDQASESDAANQDDVANKNVTKKELKETGLPVVALVLVALVAAVVPVSRRKK